MATNNSITKKDIRQAFSGYSDCYYIKTLKRGKAYRIKYYAGFHSNNIINSILRHRIYNWDPIRQTFIIALNPKMAENCLHYNLKIINGEVTPV